MVWVVMGFWSTVVLGKTPQEGASVEGEVDHLNLAALLVRDGHLDRAAVMLRQVDPDKEGLDVATYRTVQGLLALGQQRYAEGIKAFTQALKVQEVPQKLLHFYLAQCHFGRAEWAQVLAELDAGGKEAAAFPQAFLMRSHAHLKRGEHASAWEALEAGARQFPQETEFGRRQTYLLIELGLYQAASELATTYIDQITPTAADYISLALAFEQGRQTQRALDLLEQAHLRFPQDTQLTRRLAHAYLGAGYPLAAAQLLQFTGDEALAGEAAEMFKRAGAHDRALYMNAQVADQSKKLVQRVGILIAQEEFERISALDERLERLGLLEQDQNMLYAVAYAKFKAGDHAGASAYLQRIEDPELFGHAMGIQRLIAHCAQSRCE